MAIHSDPNSELQVIGCLLASPDLIEELPRLATIEDFTDPYHKATYGILKELSDAGEPIEPGVLTTRMAQEPLFQEHKPAVYLADILQAQVTTAHFRYYAKQITKSANKRKLQQITESCQELLNTGSTCGEALVKLLAASDALGHNIDAQASDGVTRTASVVLDEFLIELKRGGGDPIQTGIENLDWALGGGVGMGEMVIIAGRPSQGKTMVALQILDNFSADGYQCLLLSEEMSEENLAKRFLNRITTISADYWKNHHEQLVEETGEWKQDREEIFISVASGTIDAAIRTIDQAARRGVQVVAVDYAQLLKGNGNGAYERNTDVSVKLRQAASRNNIIMLCLCQLSRKNEEHPGTPKMSDLRDSGQYEQDADVIIFVDWPARRGDETAKEDEYYLRIRKNRNRDTRMQDVELVFNRLRQTLTSPSNEWKG